MSSDTTTSCGAFFSSEDHNSFVRRNGVVTEIQGSLSPVMLSRDGTTMLATGSVSQRGIIWRAASGPLYLPTVAGRPYLYVPVINDDGTVVAGTGTTDRSGVDYRPIRWTSTNGSQLLPLNPGYYLGTAECMANGGDTVFGTESDYDELRPTVPFRWDLATGTQSLGLFGVETTVRKCSEDGSALYGFYRVHITDPDYRTFLWTQQSGYLDLQDYLANNGITGVPLTMQLASAPGNLADVSADGRTLLFRDGYIVHLDLPPTLGGVVLPPSASAGTTFNGSVTMDHAVSTVQTVKLVSDHPTLASVPSSVKIAPGQSIVSFPIQTAGVAALTSVQVTATYGSVIKATTVRLAPAVLKSVSLKSYNVVGGNRVAGSILLSGKAPDAGGTVTLSSGNAAVTFANATVSVPGQTTTATFSLISHPVLTSTSVTFTGTYNGKVLSNSIMVQPTSIVAVKAPSYATGSSTIMVTVMTDGQAPSGGMKIEFSSSEPYLATVPSTFTIPYGGTRYNLNVATKPVYQNTPVTFSATYNNKTVSYRVLLTP